MMSIETMVKGIKTVMKENSMPNVKVTEFVYHALRQKEQLNTLLGLSHDNDYRLIVGEAEGGPCDVESPNRHFIEDLYPFTRALIDSMVNRAFSEKYPSGGFSVHCSYDFFISTNNVRWERDGKNYESKLTRLIAGQAQSEFFDAMSPSTLGHVRRELNLSLSSNLVTSFLPALGDVAGKSAGELVLSTNPLDYITASYNASFSSCFSPDGCHFNAVLSHACNPMVLIGYIGHKKNLERKIGRVWLWIDINEPIVASQRRFGAMTLDHAYLLRKTVQDAIDSQFPAPEGETVGWYRGNRVEIRREGLGGNIIYFDEMERVSYRRSKDIGAPDHFSCISPAGYCLFCGGPIISKTNEGLCSDCGQGSYLCTRCGKRKTGEVFPDRYWDMAIGTSPTVCLDCCLEETRKKRKVLEEVEREKVKLKFNHAFATGVQEWKGGKGWSRPPR